MKEPKWILAPVGLDDSEIYALISDRREAHAIGLRIAQAEKWRRAAETVARWKSENRALEVDKPASGVVGTAT